MASEIDVCNLALSYLGDSATVSSIDPPEGSAQAEHCSRFYPIARDALLEMHAWGFATKRVQLAQTVCPWPEWAFAYVVPNDALNIVSVLPSDAIDDNTGYVIGDSRYSDLSNVLPQPFVTEVLPDGTQAILTNQEGAVLRYTAVATDPTVFSPLFVITLSWHLASFLAGPIIKGDAGASESKRCAAVMQQYLSQAKSSDASQRRVRLSHQPDFMRARSSFPPGFLDR